MSKFNYIKVQIIESIYRYMNKVETLLEKEVLTVSRLKELLEELPEEMIVSDIYNGKLLEVTQVVIYSKDGEETLVIG